MSLKETQTCKTVRPGTDRATAGESHQLKTTFLELLGELTRLTEDDAWVMATIRDIFASYQVRLTRSLAPVRLVREDFTANSGRLDRRKRRSVWA